MRLTSPAFSEGDTMGTRFTPVAAGGSNVSPPFEWADVPAGTLSLALAVVDRHPVAHDWVHWLVIDLGPAATGLPEGASGRGGLPPGARELDSTAKSPGWSGPQPPPGSGPHRYEATLYALDLARLELPHNAGLRDFERSIDGHVLERSTLNAYFER